MRTVLRVIILISLAAASVPAQISYDNVWGVESALHDRYSNDIRLAYLYGSASNDNSLAYQSLNLSARGEIFTGTKIWGSLPLNTQSGSFGAITGIGDLVLVFNQTLLTIGNLDVSIDVGTKLATGSANQGDSLPTQYQSGSGSSDLMLGAAFSSENIIFAIAYQLSGGRGLNEITKLKRGDAFIVRGGYTYRGETFDLGGELVAVHPIDEATTLNPVAQGDEFIAIARSDEIQLDMLLKGKLKFSEAFGIIGLVGIPLKRIDNDVLNARNAIAAMGMAISL